VDWSEFGITPNYPLILPRILGSFSIGLDDLLLVGTFLIALMAIAVSMIFFFATSGKPFPVVVITAVFAVLWSFSPPFMLAAERGNYDILIFVILTIAALVFHRFGWISAGLVLVSALFKLFPIAAAIGFLRLKRGWALLLVPICGLAFYLLWSPGELLNVNANTPRGTWVSFGALVLGGIADERLGTSLWGSILVTIAVHVCGFGLYLGSVMGPFREDFQELLLGIRRSKLSQGLMMVGGPVLVLVYFLGNSFDYRLIFLTFPVAAIVAASNRWSNFVFLVMLVSLLVMYWSFPSNIISPISDLLLIPLVALTLHVSFILLFERLGPCIKSLRFPTQTRSS
jgi:hypothetical protein